MGNFYMESTQINYRRDNKPKTVDQKLHELSETSAIDTDIAPVFKSTSTYHPGDMVYYRNKLYVFNVNHTGAWAAADVTATDVTTELSSLKSGLTNVGSTVNNIDNPQKYEDFVGKYIKIGRLVIFQLQVTKSKASYTLGVIPGIKTLFSTNVAVDSANGNAPIYVTNTGNNVQIQIATGILSNKSNISGCFITE